jgi:hypothetical protein
MPDIIRIEEKSFDSEQFEVRVIFNDQQFPVTVKNPYNPETQKKLDWYFENYITEPYTPVDIVNKHKDALRQYGESLFKQIFVDHKDIYFLYRTAIVKKNANRLRAVGFEVKQFVNGHLSLVGEKKQEHSPNKLKERRGSEINLFVIFGMALTVVCPLEFHVWAI